MASQRKVFRIEECAYAPVPPPISAQDAEAAMRHRELMTELQALRNMFAAGRRRALPNAIAPAGAANTLALSIELDGVQDAIRRTRRELASLNAISSKLPMARVTGELEAVVDGTEQAAQRILQAAENMDQTASTLAAALQCTAQRDMARDMAQDMAQDMRESLTQIFAACNFPDLTGQRVTKVLDAFGAIEQHILRMRAIWGGMGDLECVERMPSRACGDADLLNGPKLDGEPGHSSQDDIDIMFG